MLAAVQRPIHEPLISPDLLELKTVPEISWNKACRLLVQNSYIIIN